MISHVSIFVGTVTGTALRAAQEIKKVISKRGIDCTVYKQFEERQFYRQNNELIIVCCANTGAGDIPANIQPLYAHLTQSFPNIAGKPYAVVNLGDSSFMTFGEAGKKFDDAFEDIGANRIINTLLLDATDGQDPLQAVNQWAHALPLEP